MPLSHDMVQCGFAVVGFPNIDSMPPGPDYNNSSTGQDGDLDIGDKDDEDACSSGRFPPKVKTCFFSSNVALTIVLCPPAHTPDSSCSRSVS